MTEEKITLMVRDQIAEALGFPPARIGPDAWLKKDLGAESIDLIDLTFRFEKALGKPLSEQEIFRSDRADGDVLVGNIVRALSLTDSSSPS